LLVVPPFSRSRCEFAVIHLTLVAAAVRFSFAAEMEKRCPPQAENMDFHFIDLAWRRSEYGSNHCS
jgi:hypothetical protein